MRNFVGKAGRALGFGLLFFVLRTVQLWSGFDHATGLALSPAAGTALAVCLALAAAVEILLALRRSGEKLPFRRRFAPAGEMKLPLVMGGMLLALGGALLAAGNLVPIRGGVYMAQSAAGVLGIAAGVGVVIFTQQAGRRAEQSVLPLLPAMFFGVFLVLSEYLPEADNPVLARYYIPVLASALTAYAFSALAGCVQGEASPRWFTPVAELAAALCIAAIADGIGPFYPVARVRPGKPLVYGGCALLLLSFLALQRRDGELPAEEEAHEDADGEAEEGSAEA